MRQFYETFKKKIRGKLLLKEEQGSYIIDKWIINVSQPEKRRLKMKDKDE